MNLNSLCFEAQIFSSLVIPSELKALEAVETLKFLLITFSEELDSPLATSLKLGEG